LTRIGIAILAGGQGRRMGGGKPLRRLGGLTLMEHIVRYVRLRQLPSVLVVRAPGELPSWGLDVILDDPAIAGPLGGLATALTWASTVGLDAILTLPCDMPFLPEDLSDRLTEALRPDVSVAVAESGGRSHPICALWRLNVLETLRRRAGLGELSLHGLADGVGAVSVSWTTRDGDPFFNINSPRDLEAAAFAAGIRPA